MVVPLGERDIVHQKKSVRYYQIMTEFVQHTRYESHLTICLTELTRAGANSEMDTTETRIPQVWRSSRKREGVDGAMHRYRC